MEIASHSSYHGQVTKLAKTSIEYLKSDDVKMSEHLDHLEVMEEELEVLLNRLTAAYECLKKANIEAIHLINPDDIIKEVETVTEYEDKTIGTITRLKHRLARVRQGQSLSSPSSSHGAVKLHKLWFSGNFKEWEQYRVLVDDHTCLSMIDKLIYLETVLTDKVTETLVGLTSANANYKAAIALLKEEYGNSEQTIGHTMFSTEPVSCKVDVSILRRLYICLLASTRTLSALEIPASKYFLMIKAVLLRCLPNEIYNMATSNSSASENSSLASLSLLKKEVESLKKTNASKLSARTIKTAYGLFAANAKERCLLCKNQNHDIKECYGAQSLLDKNQILGNEGRCHNSRTHKDKRTATSLCDAFKSSNEKSTTSSTHNLSTQPSLNLYMMDTMQRGIVYLQTACAFACSDFCSIPLYVRLIMDGGSQLSFIKSSLARQLNLAVIGVHTLSVIPFGSERPTPSRKCNKVRLVLRSQHDNQAVVLNAIEVPEICMDVLSVPNDRTCSYLHNLVLADARISGQRLEHGISILIGADSYWQFATGEIRRLTAKLTAINTVLGWTIHGPFNVEPSSSGKNYTTALHVSTCKEAEKFPQLDVSENRTGNRYEMSSLPWKATITNLNENRTSAITCMQSLVRKVCRAGRIEEYSYRMAATGIAEIAPETTVNESRTYYLPHRPVYREDKETTKLRMVVSALNHSSLNDCLEISDHLLTELLVVMLNFHTSIEKAFLQILLDKSDRDNHRFLWFCNSINGKKNLPAMQIFQMMRATFGVVPSCKPFHLAATIRKIIDITSVNDKAMAKRVYRESNSIPNCATMTLREWNCNNDTVRRRFSTDDRRPRTQRVLGPRWVMATDELKVDLDLVIKLMQSGSLPIKMFDPFGILSPWTVLLKIPFQNIWQQNLDWDNELPTEPQRVWPTSREEIQELSEIAIPHHFLIKKHSLHFHIFADASQLAYGAVAYAKTMDKEGHVSVQFICAKNRVDQQHTYPPTRLLAYLQRNLQINPSGWYLWTDSQIALFWTQGSGNRWKKYNENRVKVISVLFDISSWRYYPGSVNAADLLTTSISATPIVNSSIWPNGPSGMQFSILLCALYPEENQICSFQDDIPAILNCEDFSTWQRLFRVTAVDIFNGKRTFRNHISAEEMNHAEKYWLHRVQNLYTYFYKEIAALQKKNCMHSKSELITLFPFPDDCDEFLRVAGRLQFVVDNINEAHPIMLLKSLHITRLIVTHAHVCVLLCLRYVHWIIKGRLLINTITRSCLICKVLAPLPKDRLLASRSFEVTGIDFAGPLYVTESTNQRNKMYFLLFTCAAVRAIHIEDLSTQSCLLAIRRFIPKCGVTFKKASSELRQLTNMKTSERFPGFLCEYRIRWKFIVDAAPWCGGFWVRLIGVVKEALRANIVKAALVVDQLQTLLTEVRGLFMYCGDDPLDLTPLSPAHFIIDVNADSGEPFCEQPSGKEWRKQWKERLHCLATFKTRWFGEYDQQLRSLHHVQNPFSSSLQVGDVVLLEDSSLHRLLWHLAIVEKLFPGRDGKLRTSELYLGTGSVYRKPIQILYPLEITELL